MPSLGADDERLRLVLRLREIELHFSRSAWTPACGRGADAVRAEGLSPTPPSACDLASSSMEAPRAVRPRRTVRLSPSSRAWRAPCRSAPSIPPSGSRRPSRARPKWPGSSSTCVRRRCAPPRAPPPGRGTKAGDVLIEFDGTTVARTVEEKQSEVRGFEAQIEQARSDRARRKRKARPPRPRRATTSIAPNSITRRKEILSRVEGEQRGLKVERRRTQAARGVGEVFERPGRRALPSGRRHRQARPRPSSISTRRGARLNALVVTAPSDGIVTILRNCRSGNWMNPQDFKEGDRVWPGAGIVELPDVSSLFGLARGRRDRARPAAAEPVRHGPARGAARQGAQGPHRVISALAKADFSSWPPPRNFDVNVAFDDRDERVRPGMTATIRVAVDT